MTQMYLTQADIANYGLEFIDFAQRVAAQVAAPQLEALGQQNAELHRQLARESRARLDQQVEAAIPNFREIDADPRWHQWLLGHDAINGQVRQTLLNAAIRDGSLHRVVAIFRAFMAQYLVGGAPRAARVPAQSSYDQRTYTRAEIARLYSQHHKGAFKGREAEWQALERDIIAAGREGRILNPIADVAGK